MVKKEFQDSLLQIKKVRFLECVKRTAKKIKVLTPKVIFMDESEWDGGDEKAHIHTDIAEIHILNTKLSNMSFEDIEDTASHEVDHMNDDRDESAPVHSATYYNRHKETKSNIWKPEGAGIITVNNNSKTTKKYRPIKEDKTRCNYHLCRKRRKLTRCKYCKNWYCNEHIKPSTPQLMSSKIKSPNNSHPCASYLNYKQKKGEKQKAEYNECLNNALKNKKEVSNIHHKSPLPTADSHTFITTIINPSYIKLKELFASKKTIKNEWSGGIEYITKQQRIEYEEILEKWHTATFQALDDDFSLYSVQDILEVLYKVLAKLIIKMPDTQGEANKIINELVSVISSVFNENIITKEMNKFTEITNQGLAKLSSKEEYEDKHDVTEQIEPKEKPKSWVKRISSFWKYFINPKLK